MAGLSTNAPGLWGGFAGLLYGSTSLSTPPGFLADAVPAWVPAGGVLAFEFDNGLGYNSRNLATTTPDSILTYTNPSPKMVYGSDGVLRYAPHNLLLQSQTFETASWTVTPTISANDGVAPDGTLTADLLTPTANDQNANQLLTGLSQINGVTYTFSVWMRAAIAHTASLRMFEGANAFGDTNVTVNVTTEWQRFSLTTTWAVSGTSIRVLLYPKQYGSGNPNLGVYMWGAQLNLGSSALTYIPTTTAAVYSLPIDHNPTTFEPLGVLIEEQRTNLILQSQTFGTTWAPTSASISADAGVAPDGTTTADKLIGAAASAAHFLVQTVVISNATVYTYSVYAKKVDGARYINLAGPTAAFGAGNFVGFDLQTGVVLGSPVGFTGVIQDIGGGWYRCIATSVASASTTGDFFIVLSDGSLTRAPVYTPNGTDGVLLWGAQLE